MNLSQRSREWLIITVVWVLILASTPLYMYYAMLAIDAAFDWKEVLLMWSYIGVFMAMFLIHHFILAPLILNKKRKCLYLLCVVLMMTAFAAYLEYNAPDLRPTRRNPNIEGTEQVDEHRPMMPPFDDEHHKRVPPPMLAPPDLVRLVMALLMLGVDLGGMAWLNEQKMRQRLLMLEQQNLKQELDHLRYQINPHFLMNTLNNIHALVDLDQERAKRAIIELSGMMRYSLYEGNGSLATLNSEMEFLKHYISLMKMRYNSRVEIFCEMPKLASIDIKMPPLMLATFVENAFKHGVSYQAHSFIHVKLELNEKDRLINFCCVNSCHDSNKTHDGHHGIGLENVKKRLDLQYTNKYQLIIDDHSESQFSVLLKLPY